MFLALPVILLGSQIVLAADRPPQFNIEPGCRAAATSAVAPNRTPDACKRDENDARKKVESEWSHFKAADRDRCVRLSSLGGSPSYVELITCLELAQAAANLPPGDKLSGALKP